MKTITMCSSLIPLNISENTDSDGMHYSFVYMLMDLSSQMLQAHNELHCHNVYVIYLVI